VGVACSKCRKVYEEMELMWIKIKGKMKLLCCNCKADSGAGGKQ